jgi:hypothetical protein
MKHPFFIDGAFPKRPFAWFPPNRFVSRSLLWVPPSVFRTSESLTTCGVSVPSAPGLPSGHRHPASRCGARHACLEPTGHPPAASVQLIRAMDLDPSCLEVRSVAHVGQPADKLPLVCPQPRRFWWVGPWVALALMDHRRMLDWEMSCLFLLVPKPSPLLPYHSIGQRQEG